MVLIVKRFGACHSKKGLMKKHLVVCCYTQIYISLYTDVYMYIYLYIADSSRSDCCLHGVAGASHIEQINAGLG